MTYTSALQELPHRTVAAAGAVLVAADSLATIGPIIGTVVVAVLALAGSVFTATTVLRASTQSNQANLEKLANERDKQHDERVEAENTRLRTEALALNEQRDELASRLRDMQERHARLRIAVIAQGMDPDEIIAPRKRGPNDAPPA